MILSTKFKPCPISCSLIESQSLSANHTIATDVLWGDNLGSLRDNADESDYMYFDAIIPVSFPQLFNILNNAGEVVIIMFLLLIYTQQYRE